MKTDERLKQLREALEAVERCGPGLPYPSSLRRAMVEYCEARKREGAGVRKVAAELGVSGASLMRWLRARQQTPGGFRAIEVVAPAMAVERTPVVYGPRGMRVEGLTVAQLAELMERLS